MKIIVDKTSAIKAICEQHNIQLEKVFTDPHVKSPEVVEIEFDFEGSVKLQNKIDGIGDFVSGLYNRPSHGSLGQFEIERMFKEYLRK